jgi:hypothetical protein
MAYSQQNLFPASVAFSRTTATSRPVTYSPQIATQYIANSIQENVIPGIPNGSGMGEIKQIDEGCYPNSYNFGTPMMLPDIMNIQVDQDKSIIKTELNTSDCAHSVGVASKNEMKRALEQVFEYPQDTNSENEQPQKRARTSSNKASNEVKTEQENEENDPELSVEYAYQKQIIDHSVFQGQQTSVY